MFHMEASEGEFIKVLNRPRRRILQHAVLVMDLILLVNGRLVDAEDRHEYYALDAQEQRPIKTCHLGIIHLMLKQYPIPMHCNPTSLH
jgi:hypothetical protein